MDGNFIDIQIPSSKMRIEILVMGKYLTYLCLLIILVFISVPLVTLSADTEDSFVLGDPGYLPNSVWYALEITKERVIIVFTFSNLAKSDKLLMLSTERIAEAEQMAKDKDQNNTKKALERYISTINESANRISDCNGDSKKTKKQLEKMKEVLRWQIQELNRIKTQSVLESNNDFDNAVNNAQEIINETCKV